MKDWLHWTIASFAAGVGGVFAMTTYIHSEVRTELDSHSKQPHSGSVSESRYNEDIRHIRQQLSEINQKLDRIKK